MITINMYLQIEISVHESKPLNKSEILELISKLPISYGDRLQFFMKIDDKDFSDFSNGAFALFIYLSFKCRFFYQSRVVNEAINYSDFEYVPIEKNQFLFSKLDDNSQSLLESCGLFMNMPSILAFKQLIDWAKINKIDEVSEYCVLRNALTHGSDLHMNQKLKIQKRWPSLNYDDNGFLKTSSVKNNIFFQNIIPEILGHIKKVFFEKNKINDNLIFYHKAQLLTRTSKTFFM